MVMAMENTPQGLCASPRTTTSASTAMMITMMTKAPTRAATPAPAANALEESLRSWLSRTETLIHRSESTRADWDRHLRPMLARRFAITTGQHQAKDPAAFDATGQMLFGPQLWAWVDPNNVAQTGAREPGPGRATLAEILERLEAV